MAERGPTGFLNLNKPLRWTSHDAVAWVRRRLQKLTGCKKVGHAGTLDPLASGVLVLCLGQATRLSSYVMRARKQYRAQISLGQTTTSYDAEGDVTALADAGPITLADIERVLPQFIGSIQQIPPMHSAVKIGGQKLYQLARQGKSVARPARQVDIHSIDILAWNSPVIELDVVCSSGTYIRSLAHDIGQALVVGAHLSALRRVASGDFHIRDSIALDKVTESDDWLRHIIPPYAALRHQPRLILAASEIQRVRQGQFIRRRTNFDAAQVFAFTHDKRLAAILRPRGQLWQPHKVFLSQP